MKILIITSVLSFSLLSICNAQHNYKNQVSIANGYRYIPKLSSNWKFRFFIPFVSLATGDQYEFSYQRKIKPHWAVGATYGFWHYGFYSEGMLDYRSFAPGKITNRYKYQFADIAVTYVQNWRRHKLSASAGFTLTKGTNLIVDSVYRNPGPPFDGIIYSSEHKGQYYGNLTSLTYDYLLFRKRMAVGANFSWRKYLDIYSSQIIYGVHIGVNF